MVSIAAGLVAGGAGIIEITGLFEESESGTFELKNEFVLTLAEVALVLVLLGDSSRLHLKQLRGRWGWPGRMLAIGRPLTIGLGALIASRVSHASRRVNPRVGDIFRDREIG